MNTSLQVIPKELTAREERALQHAVEVLEGKSFISRLTELTGEPLTRLLRRLPGACQRSDQSSRAGSL